MDTNRETLRGGRGPPLELIKAFHMGTKVPHPLCKPRVVGVSVVGRDHGAAQVKGALNGRVKLGDKAVELLGSHG